MKNSEEISRVSRLRERYLNTPPAVCSERAKIVTQAYKDYDGDPAVLKRAKALKRILEEVSIFIGEEELIVGNQASKPRSSPIFPEFSYAWIIEEMEREPFEKRDADRFLIDENTKADLRGLVDYWKGKTVNDLTIKALPEETFATIKNSSVFTFAPDVVICSGV